MAAKFLYKLPKIFRYKRYERTEVDFRPFDMVVLYYIKKQCQFWTALSHNCVMFGIDKTNKFSIIEYIELMFGIYV